MTYTRILDVLIFSAGRVVVPRFCAVMATATATMAVDRFAHSKPIAPSICLGAVLCTLRNATAAGTAEAFQPQGCGARRDEENEADGG